MKKLKELVKRFWKPLAKTIGVVLGAVAVALVLQAHRRGDVKRARNNVLDTLPERERKANKDYNDAVLAAAKKQQKARADKVVEMFNKRFGG